MDKEEDNADSIRAAPNGQTQEVRGSLEESDIVQQQESDGGRKRDDKVWYKEWNISLTDFQWSCP